MRAIKTLLVTTAVALALFLMPVPKANAQVSLGVQIGGPAPRCPYGYFDYSPYNCAPYGYYGPDWFSGGIFLGAGPWFRGPANFYGGINRRFDPRYGYRGRFPGRGPYREPRDHFRNFHGTQMRDGRGHERGNGPGHGPGHGHGHN